MILFIPKLIWLYEPNFFLEQQILIVGKFRYCHIEYLIWIWVNFLFLASLFGFVNDFSSWLLIIPLLRYIWGFFLACNFLFFFIYFLVKKSNIRECIMEMSNLASKLKTLKLELGEDLLVHLVLISLPTHWAIQSELTNGLLMSLYLIVCKREIAERQIWKCSFKFNLSK